MRKRIFMRKTILFFILLLIFNIAYSKSNESLIGSGIRNSSSEEIVDSVTNKITISNEFNYYDQNNTLYSSPDISLDTASDNWLLDGWDFSLQSQNIPMTGGGAQNHEVDTYIGIGKFNKIGENFGLMIGGVIGKAFLDGNLFPDGNDRINNEDYLDLRWRVYRDAYRHFVIHSGAYYVNKNLSTTTNYLGYMGGIELRENNWMLNIDYFSGSNNLSGGSAVVTYRGFGKLRLWTGLGIPEHNSGNEFYGIFGSSYRF